MKWAFEIGWPTIVDARTKNLSIYNSLPACNVDNLARERYPCIIVLARQLQYVKTEKLGKMGFVGCRL